MPQSCCYQKGYLKDKTESTEEARARWQACRCEPSMMTNCLTLAESLPWITSFLNIFCCGWIEGTNPVSLPENVCESWQQLTLSSELGRETWGGHEGLWARMYLYSCTQHWCVLVSCFGAWFQKRKINLHRYLRSLIGARGDLSVGWTLTTA